MTTPETATVGMVLKVIPPRNDIPVRIVKPSTGRRGRKPFKPTKVYIVDGKLHKTIGKPSFEILAKRYEVHVPPGMELVTDDTTGRVKTNKGQFITRIIPL